jgi:hypothetical protein
MPPTKQQQAPPKKRKLVSLIPTDDEDSDEINDCVRALNEVENNSKPIIPLNDFQCDPSFYKEKTHRCGLKKFDTNFIISLHDIDWDAIEEVAIFEEAHPDDLYLKFTLCLKTLYKNHIFDQKSESLEDLEYVFSIVSNLLLILLYHRQDAPSVLLDLKTMLQSGTSTTGSHRPFNISDLYTKREPRRKEAVISNKASHALSECKAAVESFTSLMSFFQYITIPNAIEFKGKKPAMVPGTSLGTKVQTQATLVLDESCGRQKIICQTQSIKYSPGIIYWKALDQHTTNMKSDLAQLLKHDSVTPGELESLFYPGFTISNKTDVTVFNVLSGLKQQGHSNTESSPTNPTYAIISDVMITISANKENQSLYGLKSYTDLQIVFDTNSKPRLYKAFTKDE